MTIPSTSPSEISAWFGGRLPIDWTAAGAPQITVDREEVTVVLTIAAPQSTTADDADRLAGIDGRVAGFRDDTREHRIEIAREAEHRFARKVSWGLRIGEATAMFTHLAVPVMTRLRQHERQVLDTLVAAGVARSRADALAWCVRLVGTNSDEWLTNLRSAIDDVDKVRAAGPTA
jgi:DNA-binding IclR family transcriptional regulator